MRGSAGRTQDWVCEQSHSRQYRSHQKESLGRERSVASPTEGDEPCSASVEQNPKFSGGDFEKATPDPIPNSEVKLFGADGTAREAVWESRTLPGFTYTHLGCWTRNKLARSAAWVGFFFAEERCVKKPPFESDTSGLDLGLTYDRREKSQSRSASRPA